MPSSLFSSLPCARLGGLIYLAIIVLGIFGEVFVRGSLVVLGVLLGFAGVSYLVNSFALLLAPSLASAMFPAILLPALVGELAFSLWLLVKGLDANAWKRQGSTTNSGGIE